MSRKSDFARLERIVEFIEDVGVIVERHGSVANTINDKEGQYAVTLCVGQIGELLGKIEDPEIVQQLPVREAKGMRNMIFHQYDDLDISTLRRTIESSLPSLLRSIQEILG